MKLLTTFAAIIFSFCINGQIDISGTWTGRVSYYPLESYDSLTISFTIKIDTVKGKISGSTMSMHKSGSYHEKIFSGKLYKKKDGFYVEEDDFGKKSWVGASPLIFFDRYDFDFNTSTATELKGKITCIRSSFVTTGKCHESTTVRLIKTE